MAALLHKERVFRPVSKSFAKRRAIFPTGVPNLSEEALRWEAAPALLPAIPGLHFAQLRFAGDPATAANEDELRRQACVLGWALVKDEESRLAFGLAHPDQTHGVEEARVESVRTLRRVGPDSQIVFDLVAEITQRRVVRLSDRGGRFAFLGGATVIVGPEGNVRHIVYKRCMNEDRLAAQRAFMKNAGRRFWMRGEGFLHPVQAPFALLHKAK